MRPAPPGPAPRAAGAPGWRPVTWEALVASRMRAMLPTT